MQPITDIAERRLHALTLAEELGSVTEACRRSGSLVAKRISSERKPVPCSFLLEHHP